VGIVLTDQQLALDLDEALSIERSRASLPELWIRRVERLGALGIKTYIAALGSALLAKATNPQVDSLAQDIGAGPHGYSLRKVGEFLSVNSQGRFHMGTKSRWPLNNRPFLGGPGRIDEFTKISGKAQPAYELFRDCLVDLNHATRGDALLAFAAWLRVRREVEEVEQERLRQALTTSTKLDPVALIDANVMGGRTW
jgi:hypothetical protein